MKHDAVVYLRDIKPLLTPEELQFERAYFVSQPGWRHRKGDPYESYAQFFRDRNDTSFKGISWNGIHSRLSGVYA